MEHRAIPGHLDTATRAWLAAAGKPIGAAAGTVLFRPGDACRGLLATLAPR